ncbi:MAG: hypothetical protein Q8R28_01215, partial [Dehalococcoidia bacterium]|nr:hypothetical protein [Dehalococcoidia bacterium]
NTHQKGQRVENVSWESLVVPILQRLQALAPHHDALRDMFRAWRAAGVSDMAAKIVIEQQTGKSKSEELQLPEVQQLTQYFLGLRDQREKGGDSGVPNGGTGGDNPQDPAHTGGEDATGPGPGPGAG